MIPHASAVCCWCRKGLVCADGIWWCQQAVCRAKQMEYAVGAQGKKGAWTWLYVPTPKQVVWHAAVYDRTLTRILVGGAASPGKSKWLREALYRIAAEVPGAHMLLLRKTNPDLNQSHLRFMPWELSQRGARWMNGDRIAVFPHKGAPDSIIRPGHLENKSDIENYLSAEYDVVAPDELVTFERDPMLELFTRARTTNHAMIDLRGQPSSIPAEDLDGSLVLTASNPGGRGAVWVKDFFVDHAPDVDEYPDYDKRRWAFFAARVDDNPYVKTGYRESLKTMRESRRRQLLDGDWNVFDGQFFSNWREDRHVRDLGVINTDVKRFLSMDWGYNAPGVCLFWVCLPDGHYHIEQEYKFNGDTGTKVLVPDVAAEIKRRCLALGLKKVPEVWCDPACWQRTGQVGESIAEGFQRRGVPVVKAQNDRVNGWQRLHEMFNLAPDGTPWLTVDRSCRYGIRTIPAQMQSKANPEDIDTDGDDHWLDASRYGAVSRIRFTAKGKQTKYAPGTMGELRHSVTPRSSRLGAECAA